MAASSDARASRISDLRLCSVITTVLRQAWLPSSNSQMTAVRGKHKFFNLVTLKKNLIHPIVWHDIIERKTVEEAAQRSLSISLVRPADTHMITANEASLCFL